MSHKESRWGSLAARAVALLAACIARTPLQSQAISTMDYSVQVIAIVATNPPSVTLQWVKDPDTTTNQIYRKAVGANSWGASIAGLESNATTYVDTAVSSGTNYEYRVSKSAREGTTTYSGNGYVIAAIDPPLVEDRGKCVLLVDQTFTNDLKHELTRLELDIAGDGWTVLRHDVARTASVVSVRALLQADWSADSNRVNTVFIFGHVPVPYSGSIAPDGHYPDHYGSWPADMYYADIDGTWTDSTLSNSTSGRVKNIPGDGKFDQSYGPSSVELQVGRVDLSYMLVFPNPERDLLRFYLAKDHNHRFNNFAPQPKSIIDDNFGTFSGEAFAASAWRSWAPQVGPTNAISADWPTYLSTAKCVWAYGCGGGNFTSAGGVEDTTAMAGGQRRAVFTMLFGSYFGDWDVTNNFLRAPLATQPSALTCAWSGRPHWFFHSMGAGFPIGHSSKLAMNNNSLYSPAGGTSIHIALMGDPTLRLNPISPPGALGLSVAGPEVTLSWQASSDTNIIGYHIFRSVAGSTGYVRMTASPVIPTSWTDAPPRTADVWYMVRTVKSVTSPSGIFTDMSQGIFNRLTVANDVNDAPVASSFAIATNEDKDIAFVLAGTDPDGTAPFCAIQSFPEHGRLIGSPTNMVFRPDANWYGTDTIVYHASDSICDGPAATVTVTIASINDAPVPSNQTVRATNSTATAITMTATDVENDTLTFDTVTAPTNGRFIGGTTGPTRTYWITNSAAHFDSFRYSVFDGAATSTGIISIVIVSKITALPDSISIPEDTTALLNVLTNDTDSLGYTLYLSTVTTSTFGRVTNTGGTVTFTPATNWTGTASLTYTVTNAFSGLGSATIAVSVVSVNDGPLAYDQNVRLLAGRSKAISLYMTDAETNAFTWFTNAPTHGTITGSAPNIVYTPAPGYSGPDEIQFWGNDGMTSGNTGVVSITVVPITFHATNVNFVTNGIDYVYCENAFTDILQAAAAPWIERGISLNGIDLSSRNRETNFAFRWEGWFLAPADAEYTFYASACQQMQLEIWGLRAFACTQLINGIYQYDASTNTFAMEAGLHPIAITFWKGTNNWSPWAGINFEDGEGVIYDSFDSGNLFRRTAATMGTPLPWLRDTFGHTNNYDAAELADPDGDGQPNWIEYRAGTNPTNTASRFALLGLNNAGGSNLLTWFATTNSGATNPIVIQRGTNLLGGAWQPLFTNGSRASDGTNIWTDPAPPPGPAFYRPAIAP